jgi:hypothetical protein
MSNIESVSEKTKRFDEELPRRIIVKFREELQLPYEDHVERYFNETWSREWEDLKKQGFPEITLQRVFISVEPGTIRDLRALAMELDPTYVPIDFLTFFLIDVPPGVDPFPLVEALNASDMFEYAYWESPPAPLPSLPTGDNPAFPNRRYLGEPQNNNPASAHIGGINALYVWQSFGAEMNAGNGITLTDVEKGWNLNHQDLSATAIALVSGVNRDEQQHGTNVLGILAAQDNNFGGVGIAYKSTFRVASGWATMNDPLPRWHDAILAASANPTAGDVILIEAQIQPGATLLPVEMEAANWGVIRQAAALQMTVIEAAGNGGALLDNQVDNSGQQILNSSSPQFSDSLAILVGAANTYGSLATRRPTSNFGSRVNCFAWGTNVSTTHTNLNGTDNSTPDRNDFSATSAASAIIAGAALLVQGIAKAHNRGDNANKTYSPLEMRRILSTYGTTSKNNPNSDQIGTMPDLKRIIVEELGL